MYTAIHDAPWLSIRDRSLLQRFCRRTGIVTVGTRETIINSVTAAFRYVPYENLTKIVKADNVISAASAMRCPDEVLNDFLTLGTGGTCFSLTAAVVAVFDALGIEAYPVLADRHYGSDTHCGLIIVQPENGKMLLLDPGFLLFTPIEITPEHIQSIETGFSRIELCPVANGTQLELYTIVKNNRKHRLTFKLQPISDDVFGAAWKQSFAFEMMTYPVLTRQTQGCHQYLQGNVLAVRDAVRTVRTQLTPEMQLACMTATFGIHKDIAVKALEITAYGRRTAG
jgi:arylamine N-acetyltransferase